MAKVAPPLWSRELICRFFGHRYRVLRRFSHTQRKVGCDRCQETWAMHDGLRAFVPWSGVFDELYAEKVKR